MKAAKRNRKILELKTERPVSFAGTKSRPPNIRSAFQRGAISGTRLLEFIEWECSLYESLFGTPFAKYHLLLF